MNKNHFLKNINIIFSFIIVICFICLILYRFQLQKPIDVFIKLPFSLGVTFLIAFIFNIIICLKIFKDIISGNKNITIIETAFLDVIFWFQKHCKNVMIFLASLKSPFDHIFAFMTHWYLKTPVALLKTIEILPRILLLITFMFDIFFLEKLQYTYIIIYTLLLTLLFKLILNLSIEINLEILEEVKKSYSIKDINALLKDDKEDFNINHVYLNTNNTQFKTITEAILCLQLVTKELNLLEKIHKKIKLPLSLILIIKICYIFCFGYLLFYIPQNIFGILSSMFYKFFLLTFNLNFFILIACIISLYFYHKNK